MKGLLSYLPVSMTAKLLGLWLLISLGYGIIIGIMISAFGNIEGLTNTIITRDVGRVISNAQLGRDLSRILTETNLLVGTFYGHDEVLKEEGRFLAEATETILTREMAGGQRAILEKFRGALTSLLQQCVIINQYFSQVMASDKNLHALLTRLEEITSEKIVAQVLAKEDSQVYEQVGVLIPSYRETLLQTTLYFHGVEPAQQDNQETILVIELLNILHLRLRTLLASDVEIAGFGRQLLAGVDEYRRTIAGFNAALPELGERLIVLGQAKEQALLAMKQTDEQSLSAAQQMKEEITTTSKSSMTFVLTVSVAVALLLGLFTALFLLFNIRRPMESIRRGIVFVSEGKLDTRIHMGRRDEWHIIEQALNKMIDELNYSYTTLRSKNQELAATHHEMAMNLQALESEVNQRRWAEEALLASEEQYRRFFEDDLCGAFIARPEGQLMACNPSFVRMFGFSSTDEALKRTLRDIFPDRETMEEFLAKLRSLKRLESYESQYIRGDGTPIFVTGNVTGTFNSQGELVELKGYLIDETERRQAEKEKVKLQQQLQHAQKMEAIGTLAGGVAHDFNNLLQGIQGDTELLLLARHKGEHGVRELQEILRAAQRGGDLTRQLLTFSRKVESNLVPVDINQVASDMRGLLERTIPKMVKVELNLQGNLGFVLADTSQLEQVLMNLAVNARDAMVQGGILTIGTENIVFDKKYHLALPEITPGPYVLLTVSDTGHGMDRETRDRIFDPFFTTKAMGKGTGLGLAIVYGIVKSHKGHVICYSEPGKGTTFKVYLPTIEHVQTATRQEDEEEMPRGNETILLVDDEGFILEIGNLVLTEFGYTVLTAMDGESALELYTQEKERIDLVILDIIMPGMGGEKCLQHLLTIDPQVKVIIASGYSANGSTADGAKKGTRGYISKPYEVGQMLRIVRRVIDGGS
ncbi:MAG: response regulator [Proteobacteria bacterium]|nr:response regulator [Pseudomonadota bacterium]